MTAIFYHPADPLRPPDWRYRRAVELAANHRPLSLRRDDPVTRQLVNHLKSRRGGAGRRGQPAGERGDPAMVSAIALHAGGDALRTVTEAWLLAGASPADIASRTGLSIAAILTYRACFYDVSDRLARPDYIIQNVILAGASISAAASRPDTAIKLAAYLGGPHALAGLLPARRENSDGLAGVLDGVQRINGGLFELLEYLALLEPSGLVDKAAQTSLAYSARLRASKRSDNERTAYEDNIKQILEHVQFRMRKQDDVEKCPPELRPYFYGAVEMRAEELMHYHRTGELPPIEKFLVEFPKPPAREAGAEGGGGHA